MDFDPRDYDDARENDRFGAQHAPGSRGVSDDREWDDPRQPDVLHRERDDDARELGRGPGDSRESTGGEPGVDPRDEARGPDRQRDPQERTFDPREPFTRSVNLPRGLERELVHDRDREYTLRGSEMRTLATVGAFRVVSVEIFETSTTGRTDVARESADIVLLGNDLSKFAETVEIARRAHRIIQFNFVGTLAVDAVGVALAAFGLLNPLMAAFIHVASELTFILNFARLLPRSLPTAPPLARSVAVASVTQAS